MPAQVTWCLVDDGVRDFELFIDHMIKTSGDMSDPLERSVVDVQSAILEQFRSEGSRGEEPWAPLSDRYREWKIGHLSFDPILELDPDLLHGDPGTPRDSEMIDTLLSDSSWTIGDTDALFSPESSRAAWHQEGAARSKGGALIARPWLQLTEFDYDKIYDNFENWLEDEINAR